jgi:hypothetical protein
MEPVCSQPINSFEFAFKIRVRARHSWGLCPHASIAVGGPLTPKQLAVGTKLK